MVVSDNPLADYVHTLGRDRVIELVVEWWRENRHHGIPVTDLETCLPDWDAVLSQVTAVVLLPTTHPLRVDPAVLDFATYVQEVTRGQ